MCHRTEYGDPNFLSRPITIVNFTFCCIFALFLLIQYTFLSVCAVYLQCINIPEYQPPKSLFHYTIDFLHNHVLRFKMCLVSVSSPKKKTSSGNENGKILTWQRLPNHLKQLLSCLVGFFNCHIMFSMHKFCIFSVYPHCSVLNWTTL